MSDNISINSIKCNINERVHYFYNKKEKDKINLNKNNFLNYMKILQLDGYHIYKNQEKIASEVVSAFKDRKIINIMVIAKTQSGKTGSMSATIKKYFEDNDNLIPIENIYIITGLSSCEWKDQTKKRMPANIQNRVIHRPDLPNTFVNEIKDKKNILIIMDEIHVAAKKDQTIYNTFKKAKLLNKNYLYENDIKILEFTATPDGTIYDLAKWKEASCKILAEPGDSYIGSYELLKMGRVKQYKELCGYNKKTKKVDEEVYKKNIQEIKNDIDNYKMPLYHIIRTKNGLEQDITIQNFKKIFKGNNYEFIKYDRESDIKNINNTLVIKPERHTFIFIKEMLRCAKTLEKPFLGILYDRYTKNPDDSVGIQGLVGRDSGYDDNGISICYTNIPSIKKYDKLWNSKFEDKTIKWNSKTTIYLNGVISGKNTFNDPKNYDGFSVECDDSNEIKEPIIKKFKTQEQAKEYYNKELKDKLNGKGPNKRKPDENGFYLSTVGKGENRTRVRTTEEIYDVRRWALNETHHYTFHPCYRDINDKSTLEWWFIHY
jgi:hypothetical protein